MRGLDYYRHTAFEFVTDRLGAQGTVLAGGRYDGLIGSLGGPETPGVGWAAGVERLAMLIDEPKILPPDVSVIPETPSAELVATKIVAVLREGGLRADMAFRGKAKKRFEDAAKAKSSGRIIVARDQFPADQHLTAGISVRANHEHEGGEPQIERIIGVLKRHFMIDSHLQKPQASQFDAVIKPLAE